MVVLRCSVVLDPNGFQDTYSFVYTRDHPWWPGWKIPEPSGSCPALLGDVICRTWGFQGGRRLRETVLQTTGLRRVEEAWLSARLRSSQCRPVISGDDLEGQTARRIDAGGSGSRPLMCSLPDPQDAISTTTARVGGECRRGCAGEWQARNALFARECLEGGRGSVAAGWQRARSHCLRGGLAWETGGGQCGRNGRHRAVKVAQSPIPTSRAPLPKQLPSATAFASTCAQRSPSACLSKAHSHAPFLAVSRPPRLEPRRRAHDATARRPPARCLDALTTVLTSFLLQIAARLQPHHPPQPSQW